MAALFNGRPGVLTKATNTSHSTHWWTDIRNCAGRDSFLWLSISLPIEHKAHGSKAQWDLIKSRQPLGLSRSKFPFFGVDFDGWRSSGRIMKVMGVRNGPGSRERLRQGGGGVVQ